MKVTGNQDRDLSIDLIKIIAMIGVISLHCNMKNLENPVAYVLSRCAGISIPLFFMVSGYLLVQKNCNFLYSLKKIYGIIKYVFICSCFYWILQMLSDKEWNLYFIHIFLQSFVQRGPFGMFWYLGAMCVIYLILPIIKKLDINISFFFPKLLGGLICINFIIFVLTYDSHFEYSIRQTFRIWNWLTYFSLGAIIRKYNRKYNISIRALPFVILFMCLFVTFVYYCKPNIGGIEYFFTTPLCMAYASLLFMYIKSRSIKNSTIISELSKLFLPVYTFHYFIIKGYKEFINIQYAGIITPLIDFIGITSIILAISYVIMKMPFSKKIFTI